MVDLNILSYHIKCISTLIICGFSICKFVYSLIFIYNTQNQYLLSLSSQSLMDLCKAVKNLSAGHVSSQEKLNKATLCLLVSTHLLWTNVLFVVYLVPHFCIFLCLWLVILVFKMTPKHSTQKVCSVPKHKMVVPYHGNECVAQISSEYELVMSSMLMNQRYIFSKVSLTQNKVIDWLTNKL